MGNGCREQAEYAKILGVGPEIYSMVPEGYMMERLYHEPLSGIYEYDIFTAMLRILKERVWIRPHQQNGAWRETLIDWGKTVDPKVDIHGLLLDFFPDSMDRHPGVYIHGDPTLSNVMSTLDGELKLIDPIKPTGKMPWMIEVDLGKMLQSVIGWEHVVFGWDLPHTSCIDLFNAQFTEDELSRGVFWLMIHAMRILPYASFKNDVIAYEWARHVYSYINLYLRMSSPCNTLLILTGHSRILGTRYWPHIAQSELSRQQTSSEKLGESG